MRRCNCLSITEANTYSEAHKLRTHIKFGGQVVINATIKTVAVTGRLCGGSLVTEMGAIYVGSNWAWSGLTNDINIKTVDLSIHRFAFSFISSPDRSKVT